MTWILMAVFPLLVQTTPESQASPGPCHKDCAHSIPCEREVVACLLQSGHSREAIERIKPLWHRSGLHPAWAQLLAKAYLAADNPFWAQRTLMLSMVKNPKHCGLRSWLAWLHYSQGDLDLAEEILGKTGCPALQQDRARWLLLRVLISRSLGEKESAKQTLQQVPQLSTLYPEDQKLWHWFRQQDNPGWIEPLSGRLELRAGATSNASAGSPTDPGVQGPTSPLLRLDHFLRFVAPLSRKYRPMVEAGFKAHAVTEATVANLSYAELSGRGGVYIGTAFPRLLLAYKADLLLLGHQQRRYYYEGHRFEAELETKQGALFFAGAGQRWFHENGRSRNEMDGGAGYALTPLSDLQLLLAASPRFYDAIAEPYDQLGGSGLAFARWQLGYDLYLRAGAILGLDYYLNSGGERGYIAFGTENKRLDMLLQARVGIWSKKFSGFDLGLNYDFAWRISTANETAHYDYMEHRLMLIARWSFALDPWAPRSAAPDGHIPLDYSVGADGAGAASEERIQDLLRQDEAARRGSSCVN